VVCFFEDITKRKQAEQARRRLEVLIASNEKLKQEIVRRQAVEVALTKSEQATHQLLEVSRHLQGKLRHYSHQILMGQENQRKKISRELHDDISQLLVGINVHLEVFARTAVLNPQAIRKTIAPLRRLVGNSLRAVHRFARELRPASLDDLGLLPALRTYLGDQPKRKGRVIEFTAFAGVEALDNDKRTMLYRVAQEALTNANKHARASVVKVSILEMKDGVCLEIADNGKAFEVGQLGSAKWGNRLGLVSMRERVEMVGGRFSLVSVAGVGTTIRAEVPFGGSGLPG
jgi:signal transduction histidine kinase